MAAVQRLADEAERIDFLLDSAGAVSGKPARELLARAAAVGAMGPQALLEPAPRPSARSLANLAEPSQLDDPVLVARIDHSRADDEPEAEPRDEGWARRLLAGIQVLQSLTLVVIVTVAGLMTHVINDDGYAGGAGDVLELWTWGFGVAVTGGTVLSVYSQLRGTAGQQSTPAGADSLRQSL